MPLYRTRPAAALLGALLCLAACAPTVAVSVPPTATMPPTSTVASTLTLAPTPTNVPAGWIVLATTHFSLAYPSDWTPDSVAVDEQTYVIIWGPAKRSAVQVTAVPRADVTTYLTPYCRPESEGAHTATLANLPMTFKLTGLGNTVRVWRFANAQQTLYLLSTGDAGADAATQAQDAAILATFRPDNATPWPC